MSDIIQVMDYVRQMRKMLKAAHAALRAYGIASPYTKQVVYSSLTFVEERCRELRRVLDNG